MRADVKYTILIGHSEKLEVDGNGESILITRTRSSGWDHVNQTETKEEVTQIQLSPEDAVELAEMILKTKDHVNELERARATEKRKY